MVVLAFGVPGSGLRATRTGPDWTRATHAIRVLSAKPRRRRVFCSSSSGWVRHPPPSRIATGSAPQTPIRQPASMGCFSRSARASRLIPMSALAGLPVPAKVTSAPAVAPPPPMDAWATFLPRLLIWMTGSAGRAAASSSYWRPLT